METLTIMNTEDWNELIALKDVISYNPASVSPENMDKFTELFVKTLRGKGENSVCLEPTNY
jgi:hypothetical protein